MEKVGVKRKSHVFTSILIILLLASNIITAFYLLHMNDSLSSQKQFLAENKGKIELLQKEINELESIKGKYDLLQDERKSKNDKINELTSEITRLNEELKQSTQSQPAQSKTHQTITQNKPIEQNNSSTSFTIGSSKNHVKKIMGSPDNIILNSWWYGQQSWVSFDKNGLVDGWYDGGNILKTN